MKLIFYKPVTTNGAGEQLQSILQGLASPDQMETCETIDGLSHAVLQRGGEPTLVVLLATDRGDLQKLLGLKDLLSDFRVILIVPDRKSETISAGHLLRPRFLGFPDDDFTEMAAVLAKTVQLMVKESRWCWPAGRDRKHGLL